MGNINIKLNYNNFEEFISVLKLLPIAYKQLDLTQILPSWLYERNLERLLNAIPISVNDILLKNEMVSNAILRDNRIKTALLNFKEQRGIKLYIDSSGSCNNELRRLLQAGTMSEFSDNGDGVNCFTARYSKKEVRRDPSEITLLTNAAGFFKQPIEPDEDEPNLPDRSCCGPSWFSALL